jgi:hypothetical protein
MPRKRGPDTYRGYLSPPTGTQPPCIKRMVRKVYGNCRVQHPGEDPMDKAMCARIAWTQAKRSCRKR